MSDVEQTLQAIRNLLEKMSFGTFDYKVELYEQILRDASPTSEIVIITVGKKHPHSGWNTNFDRARVMDERIGQPRLVVFPAALQPVFVEISMNISDVDLDEIRESVHNMLMNPHEYDDMDGFQDFGHEYRRMMQTGGSDE